MAVFLASHIARRLSLPLAALLLTGCTHLAVEDCGSTVLGENAPRIRSSSYRMLLADLPAASSRFLDYAAMSSLAYAEDGDCGTKEEDQKISPADRAMLTGILSARGWRENRTLPWVPPCEDDTGLFLRVFEREAAGGLEVVIAFRGTWGAKDWLRGNLHWLTRFLPMEDQYGRARAAATAVFRHYEPAGKPVARFLTTGHSLGGGLAQHVLYTNPKRIVQAVTFNPSSVTGFADQPVENQIAGCACDASLPPGEPRIYRIYDAYEILANLRIFHKVFFPPERHVQEIRFPNKRSHSMLGLTQYLHANAGPEADQNSIWFSGVGEQTPGVSCTQAFIDAQAHSCRRQVTEASWSKCPQ